MPLFEFCWFESFVGICIRVDIVCAMSISVVVFEDSVAIGLLVDINVEFVTLFVGCNDGNTDGNTDGCDWIFVG